MFSHFTSPKIDTNTSKSLEKDIEEGEGLNVLKQMKNNKSPGSNRYTAELKKNEVISTITVKEPLAVFS